MKKLFPFLFLLASPLLGEECPPSYSYWDCHPIHVGGQAIRLGHAKIEHATENGHLQFGKAGAYFNLLIPISKESYFFPSIEWDTLTVKWNKNPKFHKTHFSYLDFGLTFYTIALEKWRWIAQLDYRIDPDFFSLPGPYGLYTGLLWGTYQIHRKWHYHIGGMGYKGLKGQRIYPVIGVDFAPDRHWFFQAVFPLSYIVQYRVGKYVFFSLKGRPLWERLRVGKREPQPRSILSYSTMGAEFNFRFEVERRVKLELYGGYNFGGSFYIKSEGGHRPLYTSVEGSPYAGTSLDFAF